MTPVVDVIVGADDIVCTDIVMSLSWCVVLRLGVLLNTQ